MLVGSKRGFAASRRTSHRRATPLLVVLQITLISSFYQVCADAGGIPSLVSDGETGFLFRPGNTKDLVDKVNRLVDDATLRKQMGEAGRAEALRWNWESATSVLRNVQYPLAERHFQEREREGWNDRRMI